MFNSSVAETTKEDAEMETTITTRTDLVNWLANNRPDVDSDEFVRAVADAIQASDHPAWGTDWTAWLAANVEELVEAVLLYEIDPARDIDNGADDQCAYWREVEFHHASTRFDGGEFAAEMDPASEPCGHCTTCRKSAEAAAEGPQGPEDCAGVR